MFTADERAMHQNFEKDLGDVLDKFLRLGMDINVMEQTLSLEASGRLWDRRDVLDDNGPNLTVVK